MKPSRYCYPHATSHARDEVIDNDTHIGTCRICGGQRQYPQPSLKSILPEQFADAHADNIGRKRDAVHVGFEERKWRR